MILHQNNIVMWHFEMANRRAPVIAAFVRGAQSFHHREFCARAFWAAWNWLRRSPIHRVPTCLLQAWSASWWAPIPSAKTVSSEKSRRSAEYRTGHVPSLYPLRRRRRNREGGRLDLTTSGAINHCERSLKLTAKVAGAT